MRRSGRLPDSIRHHTIAGVGLLLVAAWIAAGLRHLEDDGRAGVLDSPLGILTPRMAEWIGG